MDVQMGFRGVIPTQIWTPHLTAENLDKTFDQATHKGGFGVGLVILFHSGQIAFYFGLQCGAKRGVLKRFLPAVWILCKYFSAKLFKMALAGERRPLCAEEKDERWF